MHVIPKKTLGVPGTPNSLEVPVVCLGTMTWGTQNSVEDAFAQMDLALAAGANFLDVAELYPVPPTPETSGLTEKFIGDYLTARGCREKMIIATKVAGPGREWIASKRTDPENPDAPPNRMTRADILAACDGSLRRLKTSYIDLYQLHWPDRYVPLWGKSKFDPKQVRPVHADFEEQVLAIKELLDAGKIRFWGLSNETTLGVVHFCEAAKRLGVPLPISLQQDFSLVDRRPETELAEALHHYSIGLLPYGPLAGGTLTGKFLPDAPASATASLATARHTLFPQFQQRYHAPPTMARAKEYAAIARENGLTPTALALRFCLSRWYVGSTIVGATSVAQLQENLDAFRVEVPEGAAVEDVALSAAVLAQIDAVHAAAKNPNASD